MDGNGHVGRPCEVSLTPPYPELCASYGASAVTRTSGRGHVAEAKTNVIEVIVETYDGPAWRLIVYKMYTLGRFQFHGLLRKNCAVLCGPREVNAAFY